MIIIIVAIIIILYKIYFCTIINIFILFNLLIVYFNFICFTTTVTYYYYTDINNGLGLGLGLSLVCRRLAMCNLFGIMLTVFMSCNAS